MVPNIKPKREHLVITPFFSVKAPPLGVACLKAYLKQFDIEIDFTDYRLDESSNDIISNNVGYNYNFAGDLQDLRLIQCVAKNYLDGKDLLSGIDDAVKQYVTDRPLSYFTVKEDIKDIYLFLKNDLERLSSSSLVGFTTYATNIFYSVLLACMLKQKKPGITIVFGGPQVSESELTAELVLKLGIVDVIGLGDGEEVLHQIIKADRANQSLAVAGTMTIDSKKKLIKKPGIRLNIKTLPCPDFSGININQYASGQPLLPLYTSRGCPYKCEFCNEYKMWDRYRRLEVDQVIDWMHSLNRKYGTIIFYMADSLVNTLKKWTEEFADKLIKLNTPYQWQGMFRADNIDLAFAKKLKQSGLRRALIGAEAYTNENLERMRKQTTSDDNLRAAEALCAVKVPLEISNIIGFPGETEKDFQIKQEFYYALSKKFPGTFVVNSESFRFVPGSGVYKNPDKFDLKIIPWDQNTIDRIPQISDTVAKIPMAVISNPDHTTIFRWHQLMGHNFMWDKYSKYFYRFTETAGSNIILLRNLTHESVVKIGDNIRVIETKKGVVYTLCFHRKSKCILSKAEFDICRALQQSGNVKQTLKHLDKDYKGISINKIKDCIDKLINAEIILHIRNPLPEQQSQTDKAKPTKNLNVI